MNRTLVVALSILAVMLMMSGLARAAIGSENYNSDPGLINESFGDLGEDAHPGGWRADNGGQLWHTVGRSGVFNTAYTGHALLQTLTLDDAFQFSATVGVDGGWLDENQNGVQDGEEPDSAITNGMVGFFNDVNTPTFAEDSSSQFMGAKIDGNITFFAGSFGNTDKNGVLCGGDTFPCAGRGGVEPWRQNAPTPVDGNTFDIAFEYDPALGDFGEYTFSFNGATEGAELFYRFAMEEQQRNMGTHFNRFGVLAGSDGVYPPFVGGVVTLDNVTASALPEPASMALVAFGSLMMLRNRRRRA